jgi:hypothetical protein
MAWKRIASEDITGPDEKPWEIDLLMDKDVPSLPRTAEVIGFKLKASAYQEGDHRFAILGSASVESVQDAKTTIMKEARRRIKEEDWELSGEYKLP